MKPTALWIIATVLFIALLAMAYKVDRVHNPDYRIPPVTCAILGILALCAALTYLIGVPAK